MRKPSDCRRLDRSFQTAARAKLAQPGADIASDVSVVLLQNREVELGDRLFDQTPMVGVVERLACHLRRSEQAQLDDLEPDLLQRAPGLGLDLLARLLEPALAVG